MRYERSFAINKRHEDPLELIRRGAYSSPSLAGNLGVSEQTIYKDILFLRRQGHSIESKRPSKGSAYRFLKVRQKLRIKGERNK